MGQSTEELNTEIAGTRERMAADLDALQDRVSPSAIVDRRKAAARGKLAGWRDKVMGTAHDLRAGASSTVSGTASGAQGALGSAQDAAGSAQHSVQDRVEGSPLAAGLVAFGAGVVLAGLFPATAKEARVASAVADTAQDKGAPLVEEARSVGQDLGQDLKERATGAAQEVKDTAAESAARVKDEGRSAAESVRSEAQANG
jgi:hypothetical protein